MTLRFHPLANLFPLLEGSEFEALAEDIRQNGVREPIVMLDGQILDGRNRWRASQRVGVQAPTVEYVGGDAMAFVISLNLHRRHLNESQRGMVASKIENLAHGQRADRDANLHLSPVTRIQAADMLNVGTRTVAAACKVHNKGAPELVQAVTAGVVSVSAAADVAELPKPQQAELVARGEREILQAAKEIRASKAEKRREERLEQIITHASALPDKRYPVIYADPPWRYEHAPSESRAIENQYPTMTHEEICNLPIADLVADDAILFMWATSPKLAEAMAVLAAWGFTYRTCAIWDKEKIGMGYYFRQQHELLLLATRGSMPAPAVEARDSSVYREVRGPHSAKPEYFSDLICRMYPGVPRIELFNRGGREGWDVWGNQSAAA